jgi:hypothetical protein
MDDLVLGLFHRHSIRTNLRRRPRCPFHREESTTAHSACLMPPIYNMDRGRRLLEMVLYYFAFLAFIIYETFWAAPGAKVSFIME